MTRTPPLADPLLSAYFHSRLFKRSLPNTLEIKRNRERNVLTSPPRTSKPNEQFPFKRTSRALTHQVITRRGISDFVYKMNNGETQLVVCREVGERARAPVGYSSSVCGHRFRSGFSETSQRGSIGSFEFKAPEERDQAFAEHRIICDMICDIETSRFFGFFTSKLCKDEEAPTITGSIAKG